MTKNIYDRGIIILIFFFSPEAVLRMFRRSLNRLRSGGGRRVKSRRLKHGRRSRRVRKSTIVRRRGIRSKHVDMSYRWM